MHVLISIIIPVYNEEKCITSTIKEIYNFFSARQFSFEVIVVDDCSKDQTSSILKDLAFLYPSLRIIRSETNTGKGGSVRVGVLQSNGDYCLFMDADLSTPLNQFDYLWNEIKKNDIVIASRALPGSVILRHQRWVKEFIARLGNKVIRFVLGLPFYDTQCGFKIFSRKATEIFDRQTINRWGFDMEILYIAKKHQLNIAEVPVIWINDPSSTVRGFDYVIVFFDVFVILFNNLLGKYNRRVRDKII